MTYPVTLAEDIPIVQLKRILNKDAGESDQTSKQTFQTQGVAFCEQVLGICSIINKTGASYGNGAVCYYEESDDDVTWTKVSGAELPAANALKDDGECAVIGISPRKMTKKYFRFKVEILAGGSTPAEGVNILYCGIGGAPAYGPITKDGTTPTMMAGSEYNSNVKYVIK